MFFTLLKVLKKIQKDKDIRKGLNKLKKQLQNDKLYAGRGAKKLPSTKTIFYIFSSREARLFFKYSDKEKGAVSVIEKLNKDN